MNQPTYGNPYGFYNPNITPYYPQMQAQKFGIPGKIVQDSVQVVANDVPMDGSFALFPKSDMTEIYAKQWSADGTIQTVVYRPVVQATEPVQSGTDYNAIMAKLDELTAKIEQIGKPTRATKAKESEG